MLDKSKVINFLRIEKVHYEFNFLTRPEFTRDKEKLVKLHDCRINRKLNPFKITFFLFHLWI